MRAQLSSFVAEWILFFGILGAIFLVVRALARIEAFGHDRETGRDREATKAGSAPKPVGNIERGERK